MKTKNPDSCIYPNLAASLSNSASKTYLENCSLSFLYYLLFINSNANILWIIFLHLGLYSNRLCQLPIEICLSLRLHLTVILSLCSGLLVTRGSSFSTEDNVCFVSQNLSLVFTWLILGCIALSNHLCWLGFVALEWLHSLYCKIPQISPGTYIFQRPLFSGTYNQCKICILKLIKL